MSPWFSRGNGEKLEGRGVRIVHLFSNFPPGVEEEFKESVVEAAPLASRFAEIMAYSEPHSPVQGTTRIKVFCNGAKFRVSVSEAPKYYTEAFFDYWGRIGTLVAYLQQKYPQSSVVTPEFGLLVTYVPREDASRLVPLFPLQEIGAFLLIGHFYASVSSGSRTLDDMIATRKTALSKDDIELLTKMTLPSDDYRSFVSQNAQRIISVMRKIGLIEPYSAMLQRNEDLVVNEGFGNRSSNRLNVHSFSGDPMHSLKVGIVSAEQVGTPLTRSFVPYDWEDVAAINDFNRTVFDWISSPTRPSP